MPQPQWTDYSTGQNHSIAVPLTCCLNYLSKFQHPEPCKILQQKVSRNNYNMSTTNSNLMINHTYNTSIKHQLYAIQLLKTTCRVISMLTNHIVFYQYHYGLYTTSFNLPKNISLYFL